MSRNVNRSRWSSARLPVMLSLGFQVLVFESELLGSRTDKATSFGGSGIVANKNACMRGNLCCHLMLSLVGWAPDLCM